MGRTRKELLASLDSAELTAWQAFFDVEPFGPLRDNLHAGIIAAALINGNPWRRKGARDVTPSDFLLTVERPRQTVAEMKAALAGVRPRRKRTRRK